MQKRAFTLLEIMIVVVIVGMLAALAFPVYVKVRLDAVRKTAVNDARLLAAAVNQYCTDKGVTTVPVSILLGEGRFIKQLSPGNTVSAAGMELASSFTYTINHPFFTAGALTFDADGRLIADPN
ncbi:MAG: prepilin-type N-terminal cleavage/methylation domain-containing protein [Nibricoccus sp.]